ncbi:MAG: transglutaminase domain-containing protein [Planctomycetes bacterium]|nr:transglutaminase domain-containing protein [Planctomycetota bacterium]
MIRATFTFLLLLASLTTTILAQDGAPVTETVTYRVRQKVTISEIARDAKRVDVWVSIPGDDRDQEVLDLDVVSSPGDWTPVQDAERRGRFIKVRVANPGKPSLDVVVDFVLRRRSSYVDLESGATGVLNDSMRRVLAPHLRLDAPHMEVTEAIRKLADETCGSETDLAKQALLLLERVAADVDHYSKDPSKPSCGVGDASACMVQGGGCCTDLHSLFISLARARGIPAKLQMGYRLREKNRGLETDPGYRCWVEYFVPGHGWIASDIVEADGASSTERRRWLTGLTARRLWLNEGRDFVFAGSQVNAPVNHMSIAHAEIDGWPARLLPEGDLRPQITRTVQFEEVSATAATLDVAATH